MRIIGGRAGGTVLTVPSGLAIRPTADRVKESLFSSLGDIQGWTVADFFAGSGALGLEAFSRGAARVVLVEHGERALRCIRENLERARRAAGDAGDADVRVLRADVAWVPRLLPDLAGKVDLVLADPPYQPPPGDFGGAELLRDEALAAWAGGALLVLEHATETKLPWAPVGRWRLVRQRRFGIRTLSYCRRAEPGACNAGGGG